MYVLDTNVLIYFFKGIGNVSNQILNTPKNDIGVPSIVIYEIETGIAKSQKPARLMKQLDLFLSHVNVFPFGRRESACSAKIRAELEKEGNIIGGPYDILIAGTAVANNATLITHNTKEFSRIKSLKIEDWY